MHPAYSVIFFTALSGAGYGLLAVLGVGMLVGLLPPHPGFALTALALCLGLIVGGLLCSTLHLHHPERALLAFSQWRSSWLSREGVAAVATFLPAGALGLAWLFPAWLGWLGAAAAIGAIIGAAATVFCTAMIYASLKPVAQWRACWGRLPLVPLVYFAFAFAGGMVCCQALLALFADPLASVFVPATCVAVALAWAAKLLYWRRIDALSAPDLLDATGLKGDWQRIRAFDPPHTERNYLQKEMGYRIARKHRGALRRLAWVGGGVAPIVLLAAAGGSPAAGLLSLTAALLVLAGTLLERWLFFAEAQHTCSLYYGDTTLRGREPTRTRAYFPSRTSRASLT